MHGPCSVPWPFTTAGNGKYGQFKHKGVRYLVNRFVCEMVHGPAPSPEHEAAHRCGNSLCFSAGCLRWLTPAENSAERIDHGTDPACDRNPRAKLAPEDVQFIRESTGNADDLAARFEITRGHVNKLRRRGAWASLS